MTPTRNWLALLGAAALLAACETATDGAGSDEAAAPETAEATEPATEGEAGTETARSETGETGGSAAPGPHIYMALQPGGTGHPDSVVFAIDSSRDGTPSDDPAIRLTPDAGQCNPQEMRSYEFGPENSTPVVGQRELEQGLTASDLPRFLAAAVTGHMIDADLASEPEETRPLNVCTRKLWERLVAGEGQTATE